jgi:uncharacterized protein (DUF1800 family)
MKSFLKILHGALFLMGAALLLSSFLGMASKDMPADLNRLHRFPYREAGLTERQAAAHLLSRFTYGATPEEVDEVVRQGLEKWFAEQLKARLRDDSLEQLLSKFDALKLSNSEVTASFPKPGQILRMAVRDGKVDKDSVKTDRKEFREAMRIYMQEKGLKPEQELFRQFINQKILRAAYSHNQLLEVMTDFWFNHFNVSITKNDCAQFIPAYERDVIRPNALGHFDELLIKTAQSPAMLYYLDNFSSSAPAPERERVAPFRLQAALNAGGLPSDSAAVAQAEKLRRARGLNENYAREVMELHTLGVDGGYSQQDVTQAARVLTGWTVYPTVLNPSAVPPRLSDGQLKDRGFVREGDFFFNANRHDNGNKVVLGKSFGGLGYQEGVDLLEMLAHHPSTAHFICRKIATRFVCDDPPATLVERMAKTFQDKDGDIREVLLTLVYSQEFWSQPSVRQKTKSPFELAIGAVRSLHATIHQPYQLYLWVTKMGEKKYYYQAPTGFPDKGTYWINTGSLLNRMNFGLALAAGRIPGITVDLAALNDHHEPESAVAALAVFGKRIMPERDLSGTIKRLTPMLNDPGLAGKVDAASARENGTAQMKDNDGFPVEGKDTLMARQGAVAMNNTMLAQVVGIIIGSPEYQRR